MDDINIIQQDIDNLLAWSIKWQLPLNLTKCKGIHFGKKNPEHHYTIGGQSLLIDTEEKDVGVIFDPSLEFRQHISKIVSKANQRVGLIKRSFTRLNIDSFKILYKSLVRPILEYCSVVWFPLRKSDALEIEKVQRRATKLIPELKDLPYSTRLRRLNLTTLAYRRQRIDILQIFRIIKQIDRIPLGQFFEEKKIIYRGHHFQFFKKRPDSRIRENSFSFRTINLWNDLPLSAIQCLKIEDNTNALNGFKRALEIHWRNCPIKFEFE